MDRNQALLNAVVEQREAVANQGANDKADLVLARARIAELEGELAALKPKE